MIYNSQVTSGMKIIKILLSVFLFSPFVYALEPLDEESLDQITGQGGVYLTGDITINEQGGPLNVDGPGIWTQGVDCSVGSTNRRCGARLAVNAGDGANSGWLVLDNIRGRFSFEGLTLRTREINSGFNGDGATFNNDVLEVGLPNTVNYSNVTFTVANSNQARPTDPGFQQTDIFSVRVNGDVTLEGNLLLFPTGTP